MLRSYKSLGETELFFANCKIRYLVAPFRGVISGAASQNINLLFFYGLKTYSFIKLVLPFELSNFLKQHFSFLLKLQLQIEDLLFESSAFISNASLMVLVRIKLSAWAQRFDDIRSIFYSFEKRSLIFHLKLVMFWLGERLVYEKTW